MTTLDPALPCHRNVASACLARPELFRPWELALLASMQRRLRPTRRQASILCGFAERAAVSPRSVG